MEGGAKVTRVQNKFEDKIEMEESSKGMKNGRLG